MRLSVYLTLLAVPLAGIAQAVDYARTHNASLLATAEHVFAARSLELTAGLRQNPLLVGESTQLGLANDDPSGPTFLGLGLQRTFEEGGKRALRLQAARAGTLVTVSQAADARRTVDLAVWTAFTRMLLAKQALTISSDNLAGYRHTVDLMKVRQDAGDVDRTDIERHARVVLANPGHRLKPAMLAQLDKLIAQIQHTLSKYPGTALGFSQQIQDNVEEAMSGVKGENSLKIFDDAAGFTSLAGVATPGAVVFLAGIQHAQQGRGHTLREGALNGMRPVLMACMAAGLGLLPAALSNGVGAQAKQPLARAVVGGMVTTALSFLLLTPLLARRSTDEHRELNQPAAAG